MLGYILLNVVFQASIIILLNVNFHLAVLADLNIGIAQTVHASQAFFVAFLDFLFFSAVLKTSQLIGMLTILVCVVFISFSTKVEPAAAIDGPKLPVYIPILFSFTVPIAQAAYIMVAKRVTMVLEVNPWDFTFGVYFVMASAFQIYGVIYWYQNEGSF
jgi:drug/metabolite transporter (DMT)-like permease